MIDSRITRLHIEILSVPQRKDLNDESLEYFWYSIATAISCFRDEWVGDALLNYIEKIEQKDDEP